MPISDQTPTFNLKVVAQETGLKPDTLRAWERRYGLPEPARTSGRHRVYSQRDIDTIKWLMARQEEGLSISRAVELWHSLEAEGQDPLESMAFPAGEPLTRDRPGAGELAAGATVATLRDAWITACLDFDEPTAEASLTQAFALYPPEMVCMEIMQKSLSHLGELWYQGGATVQQEHFASALITRRLNTLIAATPAPTRPKRIIIGCPAGEDHTFGPLLLTLMLRRRGWDALYLGANVPMARFKETLQSIKPHLVVLTAQQLYTAASLLEMARFLQDEGVLLAFGGLIFNRLPALCQRVPGHFLGERLEQAAQAAEDVLIQNPPTRTVTPAPAAYQQTLDHYRRQHVILEAHVWQILQDQAMPHEYLVMANEYLARDIMATLALGDLNFLDPEIVWVKNLLGNYDMPPAALEQYLRAYHAAAQAHLDERGRPIVEWLARVSRGAGVDDD
jgi:methanogenic corrinoid protein MtbC1